MSMSSRDEQAGSDALAALAAPAFGWLSEAAARELAVYLIEHEPAEVRADIAQAAEQLARIRERLLVLIEQKVEQKPVSPPDTERVAALERAVSDLQQQLDEGDARMARSDEEHVAERVRLIEERQAADVRIGELEAELSEAVQAANRLRAKSDSYAAALIERDSAPDDLAEEIAEAESQFTITGVIEMAREKCARVALPDAALKEIDVLDADEKSADWARELWKGLRALNAYAEESEFFQGGFWEWCEHSNSEHNLWPATSKKLAMSESDTIMNSGPLRRTRRFYVDSGIDPSGYIHMQAHMKISEGGGQHIPRLYFLDDAKGKTGAMHVGFIGPHRLVPTTQT
jgi:hypothetical protein